MNDYWKLALLAAGIAATGGLLAAPAAAAAGGAAAGAGAAGAGAAGAGGLLAAEGAAAAGAGAAGAAGAGAGGLLGAEALGAGGASALGAEGAVMAAPEMFAAEQAAAPVVDMSTQAGMFDIANYNTSGLLGKATDGATAASQYMKPVGTAMNAATAAKGLFGSPQTPQMQPAQSQMRSTPMNMDGILQQGQQDQQASIQDQMRRRQQMQAYISSIGGR